MSKPTQLEDLAITELTELINSIHKSFEKSFIRAGDFSTCIYFYNTKNSVNCYLNISNELINKYEIDLLHELSKAQLIKDRDKATTEVIKSLGLV
jgi:galactose-1-phosphate uridylyltransferase